MTAESLFRYPASRLVRWRRRLFCIAMRWLGYPRFAMRAQGADFLVGETDFIDRSIAYFGMWDGPQLDRLASVCRAVQVDLFLDVGANVGFYSIMMMRKGLAARAIAFEPDPGNYAHLMANLYLNDLAARIEAVPVALGREAATVTLHEAWASNRGESWIAHPDKPPEEAGVVASHQVPQVRFDDAYAFAGQCIVIKMDVEGSEFHALAGMERTLRENRCYVQVELYSDRIEELRRLFADLGYRYVATFDIDHFFTNMPEAA